jgi:hypothetical protein
VRQREKDLKTEALELSRRGIALNVKEDKIAALLHDDSSDSEQELSIGKFVEFLREDDWKRAQLLRPGIKQNAAVFWEYGKDKEGYYTSDDFLPRVEIALWTFHFCFPTLQLIGFFDQSGVHWRYGDDALNASRLNLRKPGKVLLRDTTFESADGRTVKQKLTYFDEEYSQKLWNKYWKSVACG